MKAKFHHWYNALLSALLTVLGFGSCSEIGADEYGSPVVEYGTPYRDYMVIGTVTDEAGTAIKDIKTSVQLLPDDVLQQGYTIATALTDESGKFVIDARLTHPDSDAKLVIEDIDGEKNGGLFEGDTISLDSMERQQIEKAEHWSQGKYELRKTIKLKRHEDNAADPS